MNLKSLFLAFVALTLGTIVMSMLSSCSFAPVVITPDGTKISLGGSLMENSTEESAKLTTKDGVTLEYAKKGKNQTSGIAQLAAYGGTAYAVGAHAKQAIATRTSDNAAKVQLGAQQASVQQAGIAAKKATTSAAIKSGAAVTPVTVNPP